MSVQCAVCSVRSGDTPGNLARMSRYGSTRWVKLTSSGASELEGGTWKEGVLPDTERCEALLEGVDVVVWCCITAREGIFNHYVFELTCKIKGKRNPSKVSCERS